MCMCSFIQVSVCCVVWAQYIDLIYSSPHGALSGRTEFVSWHPTLVTQSVVLVICVHYLVCTFTFVYSFAFMYQKMQTHACTQLHIQTPTHFGISTCTHMRAHMYTSTCTHKGMHPWMSMQRTHIPACAYWQTQLLLHCT